MNIRYAQRKDAEQLAQHNVLLAKESENKTISYQTTLKGVLSVLCDRSKGFILVAEENIKIIGQIMITYEWSDWSNKNIWWIQSVYVDKKNRRQKIFTALFNEIKKIASHKDIDVLRLYVESSNQQAKQTYLKLGMKQKKSLIYEASTT
jgi:ribosomal protein S18 acetylase RimI-like enzyme